MIKQKYNEIKEIKSESLKDKSVLIIGGGYMGKEYAKALTHLDIQDVTILTRTVQEPSVFSTKFKYKVYHDGFEKHLATIGKKDLVIIATPTELLIPAAKLAIETGQNKILLEKPGSLFVEELTSLNKIITKQKVRIGYNRLMYTNFHKLKLLTEDEGGILSCKFDFTEWTHKIPFNVYQNDEYKFWGISNSLHLISMAFELIGIPKEMSSSQSGNLDWHPSGSIFIGYGYSEQNIPFSYHANWESSGRWEIQVMTKNNTYRLMPLEDIYVCKKGTVDWIKVNFDVTYKNVKFGIAEEVFSMLNDKLEEQIGMITLEKAIKYNNIAEKIFGYDTRRN